jgi:hypothetical protein
VEGVEGHGCRGLLLLFSDGTLSSSNVMSKKLKPGVKSIRLEQAGSTVKYGQSARRETEVSLPRSGLVLICIFFFFLVELGFELRASSLQNRCSTA